MTTNARYTGPRTEAGKAISSRNSTKHGLFAKRDFILEGEDEEYAQTFAELMDELAPGSVLEQTFATEITGANWRLRRCGILEFDLARSTDRGPDAQTAIQQSIDRARAQSHNILRRSLTELRKLQTERHTRILQMPDGPVPTDLGITDTRQVVNSAARSTQTIDPKRAAIEAHRPGSAAPNNLEALPQPPRGARPLCASSLEERWRRKEEEINAFLEDSSFCKPASAAPATPTKPGGSSFCKPADSAPATAAKPAGSSFCNPPATPRNAPCPCGSGVKYKRCCGKNAPPQLHTAARI
jgi:hypothetical protein